MSVVYPPHLHGLGVTPGVFFRGRFYRYRDTRVDIHDDRGVLTCWVGRTPIFNPKTGGSLFSVEAEALQAAMNHIDHEAEERRL